jgi:hypothetical protein
MLLSILEVLLSTSRIEGKGDTARSKCEQQLLLPMIREECFVNDIVLN